MYFIERLEKKKKKTLNKQPYYMKCVQFVTKYPSLNILIFKQTYYKHC